MLLTREELYGDVRGQDVKLYFLGLKKVTSLIHWKTARVWMFALKEDLSPSIEKLTARKKT